MLKLSLDKTAVEVAVRAHLAAKFPALVTPEANIAIKIVVGKGEVTGVDIAVGETDEDLSAFNAPKPVVKRGGRKAKAAAAE
jgi:hypothetical protein